MVVTPKVETFFFAQYCKITPRYVGGSKSSETNYISKNRFIMNE